MDSVGPYLILLGNCCFMPAICLWLGYALARGWVRSPIAVNRRPRQMADDDPFDDRG